MKVVDRIALKLLPAAGLAIAFQIGQPADPVPLQAPMQGGTSQVRNRRLQSGEAIIERKHCMPAESNDNRLLLDRQNRRMWMLRPAAQIGGRAALPQRGNRLLVDFIQRANTLRLS